MSLPSASRFEQGEVGGRTQVFHHDDQVLVLNLALLSISDAWVPSLSLNDFHQLF